MFPFRKILFPVDYSEPCEAVVPYVKEMMRRFSAHLTLVHAYGGETLAYGKFPVVDPDLASEARVREEKRIKDFALETFPGEHVECFTELGEAGTTIDRIVQHQGTDLVMLATHGRGPIRRFLLGSVAAKVIHDISTAVWTGTGSALTGHAPSLPYRSVLCALDDNDQAEDVLKAAVAFAGEYEAELCLVHVVETPPATLDVDFTPYKQDLINAADFKLRELKDQLGIHAPHAILDGSIAYSLRDEALRRKADLIVLGRGHSQARFARIWSHLYPIVRESPCPVLSI